jgi:hypothetical protein
MLEMYGISVLFLQVDGHGLYIPGAYDEVL